MTTKIGTDASGGYQLANHGDGIDIINSQFNTIGAGNIISGNLANGVVIESLTGSQNNSVSGIVMLMHNVVTGNLIGTDVSGTYVRSPTHRLAFSSPTHRTT